MKPLVIIPARSGSKGVPNKNIKILGDKPLISYTLDAARENFEDSEICVSTDSEEIKRVVENSGLKVPFLRPKSLATDLSSTEDVLEHAINYYHNIGYFPDVIVLLQATSPFRTGRMIKEAMRLYSDNCDMVVSVKETDSNPYYVLFEENNEGWLRKSKNGNFTRRQDCPQVWEYNGAIYIIKKESILKSPRHLFKKVVKYQMDSNSSLDIDTPLDWLIAEALIKDNTIVK